MMAQIRDLAPWAQAGHLSSPQAGWAMTEAPRLLWKRSVQMLPGMLAGWQPHSENKEKTGFGKQHRALVQDPGPVLAVPTWFCHQ